MKIKRVRKIVKSTPPAPWSYRITLTREEAQELKNWMGNKSGQYNLFDALANALNKAP